MICADNVRQVLIDALNDPLNTTYDDVFSAIDAFPFWNSVNDALGYNASGSYDYYDIIPTLAGDLGIDISQWNDKFAD